MIGVECDSRIGEIGDDQWNVALWSPHLYRHAYLRFDSGEIELAAVNGLLQFFDSVSVSLLRRDDNVFRLADLHSQQRLIEPRNYLSSADGERQRIRPFRRIEDFSGVEFAGVMNFHGVAIFNCRHLILLYLLKTLTSPASHSHDQKASRGYFEGAWRLKTERDCLINVGDESAAL